MTQSLMESTPSVAGEMSPPKESDVYVMPCSISQQRFWLLEQLVPGNTALNIPLAVQLSGPLNVSILEDALNAMVARHEVLRTSFDLVEGQPRQIIQAEARVHLGIVDLKDVPVELRQERVDQEMIAEAARPLLLSKAPIMRTTLLCLNPGENVLMLTVNHIVGDGWSNGLLVREIGVLYYALLQKKPAPLPELAFQYADYALWQQEWLRTPQFQKQLNYWKQTLDGDLPVLDFPSDFPRQVGQETTAYIESLLLPSALSDALRRLCADLDITLFMVLFSTYVVLLNRYTDQTRFMVGTTAANRNRAELENLIGLFANPLVLCPTIAEGTTFHQMLVSVRDHSLSVFAHQEVPFEMILEEVQQRKKGARKPAIHTHFIYQKAFMQPATYGDLALRPLRSVSPGSTFELTYGIVERAEGIRLQMEYHTTLFDKATIRRLLVQHQTLLEAVAANPNVLVTDLCAVSESEAAKWEVVLQPKAAGSKAPAHRAFDAKAMIKDLEQQIDRHFESDVRSFTPAIEPPGGTALVALDSSLRLLPMGVLGDVYLGNLAPDAKTQAGGNTVLGPAGVQTPVPLVKTGLLGRNREDGKLELWGVTDDMARVRGFRFNLRPIEIHLLRHPDVVEAAAVATSDATGESRITAFVVLKSTAGMHGNDLRAVLKGKISDLIMPSSIVMIPSLPKNVDGRVVKEFLPVPPPDAKAPEIDHVPLEGILHQQLIEIWQDILKMSPIKVDDNFFDLGGSSLLALRMMVQIEKLCGRPLPLSLLLTGATISHLARYIIETNNEAATPLVVVQPKGSRPPLFFLHGDWAGGGFYCNRMSQQLGDDQPFYALPPYQNGTQEIFSLEDMAAYHRAAIQKQTPHGPYLLGGYCIGAVVAMEVARQLQEAGETVAHLFLIDPPVFGAQWLRWIWPLVDTLGQLQKWDLQTKIHFYDRYCVSFSRWLRRPMAAKLDTLLHRLGFSSPAGAVLPQTSVDDDAGDGEILNSLDYACYFLAYRIFKLKTLSVAATLYFPESISQERLSKLAAASKMDPAKFSVELLPGNHITCVTKHTGVLVDKMRKGFASVS